MVTRAVVISLGKGAAQTKIIFELIRFLPAVPPSFLIRHGKGSLTNQRLLFQHSRKLIRLLPVKVHGSLTRHYFSSIEFGAKERLVF